MVTDRQFRRLRKLIQIENTLANAADRANIDEKTARKYRDSDVLPSQQRAPHAWRTREDPFQDVWTELEAQLRLNPGLQAKTLFLDLQRRGSPTCNFGPCSGGSNDGGRSKARPRRCSSDRSTNRDGSPR